MKESTKKLLKALGCMGFCAVLSGAAGKGMDFAKDKIVNGDSKPEDDGHAPTEEEIAELVEASPEKANNEEEMIENIIESTEEVREENKD